MSEANRTIARASRALLGGAGLTIVSLACTILLHGGWQSAAAAATGLGGMILIVAFIAARVAAEQAAYGHRGRTPPRAAPTRSTEEAAPAPAPAKQEQARPLPRPSSVSA